MLEISKQRVLLNFNNDSSPLEFQVQCRRLVKAHLIRHGLQNNLSPITVI